MIWFFLIVALLWPSHAFGQAVLMQLKLDETSESTTFLDSSGNSHTGTCSGTQCPTAGVVGAIGNAASFNGSLAQQILVTNTTGLKPPGTVGLSAYVKLVSSPPDGGEVASMGDSYALRVLNNGNVRWLIYIGSNNYVFVDTSGVNVRDNTFHKLEGRKTAVGLELYIDDVLRASTATIAPINYTLGANFVIGRHGNGVTNRNFTGVIDHVTVFDPSSAGPGGGNFPGGFTETQGGTPRAKMTLAQIQGFIPAGRGAFTFPPPYNTRGYRITLPSDCTRNQDCLNYIGYPFWMRINNHQNDSFMYLMVGLSVVRGGAGQTLFKLEKSTGVVTKVGNLFPPGTLQQGQTGEHYYFSFNQPYTMYLNQDHQVWAYHVVNQTFTVPVSILNRNAINSDGSQTSLGCASLGCPRRLEQSHVNGNDTVFVGTLLNTSTGGRLGCWVYRTTLDQFRFYPVLPGATFDECTVDKSGRYTISLEDEATPNDVANRIFDNETGLEILRKTGPSGTLGHMDTGYSYALGVDNNGSVPAVPPNYNATTLYHLPAGTPNTVIHFNNNTTLEAMLYPTHNNAQPTNVVAFNNQYFCGSRADATASANEVTCAKVDGTVTPLRQLIVAPIMTDIAASGGNWQQTDDYDVQPKGNLDVTGRYFIWTSNLRGARLDAFVVEVPSHLLTDQSAPAAPANPRVR